MDRIVRVDMSRREVRGEAVPEAWARLGGRALAAAIVAAEVPPSCRPLGAGNKLVLAPGLLAGTGAPCSDRLSIATKSPLTGTLKAGTAGGGLARVLAGFGIRALVIEGMPRGRNWYGLHVDAGGVAIRRTTDLAGLGISALADAAEARWGRIGLLGIGPGGEMEMAAANVSLRDPRGPVRKVGRGGLGAVFGAKRIKLVTYDDTRIPPLLAEAAVPLFAEAKQKLARALERHPLGAGLAELVRPADDPTPGCRPECLVPRPEIHHDQDGHFLSPVPAMAGIRARPPGWTASDAADVETAERLMDDIGLDSIETGVMFGLAMDAGILPAGDGRGVIRLLEEEIAKGTSLGRVLGGGTATLRRIYPQAGRPSRPIVADAEALRAHRVTAAIADSIGMCLFMAATALDLPQCVAALVDMIAARLGLAFGRADWQALGPGSIDLEARFDRAAGAASGDEEPERFRVAAASPDAVWNGSGSEIDTFWDF